MVTSTISAIPLAINGQATTHKVTDCQVQATSLVVGGSKAKLGEFPHMVMRRKKLFVLLLVDRLENDNFSSFFCSVGCSGIQK